VSASYTSRDRCIQALSDGYAKGLEGLLSGPLTHEYGRISEFKGGGFYGITHVIPLQGGVTLYSYTAVMEFTAHGQAGTIRHEPMKCYMGAMVPSPAPGSIYVKEIRGFLSKGMVWLPYNKQMKAPEVQMRKAGWSPLVDALNKDKALRELVKKVPDAKTIRGIDPNLKADAFARFEVTVGDEEDNHNTRCQVVPMGDRTLVATQHVVSAPEDIRYPLQVILRVAEKLRGQKGVEPKEGPVIQDWAEQLIKIISQADTTTQAQKPQAPAVSQAPAVAQAQPQPEAPKPVAQGNVCRVCGYVNPPNNTYCGKCGSKMEPAMRTCPTCGHLNPPANDYCGKCGKPLAGQAAAPQQVATERVGGAAAQPEIGRRARWMVRLIQGGAAQDVYVWNLWEELWVSPQATFQRLLEAVQANSHYRWVKALRSVYAPTGRSSSGGYLYLAVAFNMQAPASLAAKRVQLLAVRQGGGGGFRAVGSDDQGLTKEQYEAVLEAAITRPDAVDDLTLYVPGDS
jgi:ribosomal protein L40E